MSSLDLERSQAARPVEDEDRAPGDAPQRRTAPARSLTAVVLAAGQGTRMRSARPKKTND